MKIRKYKKEDEEKVKKLIYSVLCDMYGSTKIKWEDFSKYIIFYVAEKDKETIGCVALKDIGNKWIKLKRMYVKTQMQRKGIGSILLNKCSDFGKEKGFKKIVLTTYPEMKKAVNFYKKHGFEIVKNPSDKFFTNPNLRKYNKKQIVMERKL